MNLLVAFVTITLRALNSSCSPRPTSLLCPAVWLLAGIGRRHG